MTAIALLDIDNDPHLVADTLLSAQGKDPKSPRRVWLPALGHVPSEYASPEGCWHISRLGRKTFFLPNNAGILAFAGDCHAAFEFWAELSAKFLARVAYEPSFRIDNAFVDQAVHQTGPSRASFSLLGMFIDATGRRTAYTHNQHIRISTKNFGTCYVSGSGTHLVAKVIKDSDAALSLNGGWRSTYSTSATEDLAEHISSGMLYLDSDSRNGTVSNSPLSHFSGGFYEWYGVGSAGIRSMSPRVDINVQFHNDRVTITRAYYIEQLEKRHEGLSHSDAREFPICVMNLLLEPYEIDVSDLRESGCAIKLSNIHGVLAPSTLRSYDAPESDRVHLAGPIYPEMLQELFSRKHPVHRVRVIAIVGGRSKARRFTTHEHGAPDATLHFQGGILSLWLSARTLSTIAHRPLHLPA
ncbi:hypothetical protein [Rhodanobacter sp. MP7CTX1]|uniref:hypothetical protein n=1 Tax=Rhodanobacter sp. MP7CTX1 TaxID=2723084 RepID=UPI00161C2EBA|nr:hypothetical protein [Rhodanobacter sp. MP7CTX1]MBB6187553.1 hypothetical protein [Rhodanobacter sp. MP7CTX1]